jgi:hypothetical protein
MLVMFKGWKILHSVVGGVPRRINLEYKYHQKYDFFDFVVVKPLNARTRYMEWRRLSLE